MKIQAINDEYFGKDERKNYIKRDFSRVIHGLIQRDVILNVLVKSSAAQHNREYVKHPDGSETIHEGNFDPDNASLLASIFDTYEKGLMIDVRQLLTDKEDSAGGKFVKDIVGLNTDDFMGYYKTSKDDGVAVPHLLIGKLIENDQSENKLSPVDFIDHNRSYIENVTSELIERARQFLSKNYYESIVKNYIGLKNHKNHHPEKYDVDEKFEDFGFLKTRHISRKDKAKVEAGKIAECLNEFAGILVVYQELVGDNTSFFESNDTLEDYLQRTYALFNKKVSDDVQEKATKEIIKYLHVSLNLVGWRHNHIEATAKDGS